MMYGDVQPLFVDSSDAVSVYAAALDAAKAMGWRITAEDAPTRLQALAETRCVFTGVLHQLQKPRLTLGLARSDCLWQKTSICMVAHVNTLSCARLRDS